MAPELWQLDLDAVRRKESGLPDPLLATLLADGLFDDLIDAASGDMPSGENFRDRMRAFRAVLARLEIADTVNVLTIWEWGDERGWWWLGTDGEPNGDAAADARGEIIAAFRPIYERIETLERATVIQPIGPTAGWDTVEALDAELREKLAKARTTSDYRAVGDSCLALARAGCSAAFDPERHAPDLEQIPGPRKIKERTKLILDATEDQTHPSGIRDFVNKLLLIINSVRHLGEDDSIDPASSWRQAAIAANGAVSFVAILRAIVTEDVPTSDQADDADAVFVGADADDIPF